MPNGRVLFKMDSSEGKLFATIGGNFSDGFRLHWLSQFYLLAGNSLHRTSHFCDSGSLVLQDAWSCLSKYAGAFSLWLSTGSNHNLFQRLSSHFRSSCGETPFGSNHFSYLRKNFMDLHFGFVPNGESAVQVIFAKVSESALKCLQKGVEAQVFPILSLAAALIPPDNPSSKALLEPISLPNTDETIDGSIDKFHTEGGYRGCSTLAVPNRTWKQDAVEPKTGIKFPSVLDSTKDDDFNLTTEVLVGTGSRTMTVIKIKSMNVYAFGLYVHPYSICDKLGSKYASVPASELKDRMDFFEDLLREDIDMTVRLVVICGGIKISTVRDSFEKSLRARLQKMNPDTDFLCLNTFGSYFTKDIPLPVGTTIYFRQTADGQLITEMEGKQIGAVRSKDLCRAFFDMYIGDVPVSVQAKQEIALNVADLMRRC